MPLCEASVFPAFIVFEAAGAKREGMLEVQQLSAQAVESCAEAGMVIHPTKASPEKTTFFRKDLFAGCKTPLANCAILCCKFPKSMPLSGEKNEAVQKVNFALRVPSPVFAEKN